MGRLGHGGAFGEAGAAAAPSGAFGHNGGAGDPLTALGRQVTKLMTNRAVTSWGNPTSRLWQIICGGRPPSMPKAAVQGYVGEKVDISPRVHTMLEHMDGIDLLAFVPRGGSGMTLPLAQHLSILGHALVTIAIHGLPMLSAGPSTTGPTCSTTT